MIHSSVMFCIQCAFESFECFGVSKKMVVWKLGSSTMFENYVGRKWSVGTSIMVERRKTLGNWESWLWLKVEKPNVYITFVYCRCTRCTESQFPCNWCIKNHKCVYQRDDCGPQEKLVNGRMVVSEFTIQKFHDSKILRFTNPSFTNFRLINGRFTKLRLTGFVASKDLPMIIFTLDYTLFFVEKKEIWGRTL